MPRSSLVRESDWLLLRDRAVGGESIAMGLLMEAIDPVIRRFVHARVSCCSPDLLDDLAQDAFVHVIPRLASCRATSMEAFRAWLFTVVQHVVAAHFRSAATQVATRSCNYDVVRDLPDSHEVYELPRQTPTALTDSDPTEVTSSIAGQLARMAVDAQRSLAPEAVELIYGHIVEGETWSALAMRLGTTAAAAKRRYQRAQGMLRRVVQCRVDALPPRARIPLLNELRRWTGDTHGDNVTCGRRMLPRAKVPSHPHDGSTHVNLDTSEESVQHINLRLDRTARKHDADA